MKKLKVNTEGCIGCGACVGLDPEHFAFNDDCLSVVKSEENIDPEKIQNIVEICPVSVISYEECEAEGSFFDSVGSNDQPEKHCEHCGCSEACEADSCKCEEAYEDDQDCCNHCSNESKKQNTEDDRITQCEHCKCHDEKAA